MAGGGIIYGIVKSERIRLDGEDEFNGADLAIHKIPRPRDGTHTSSR